MIMGETENGLGFSFCFVCRGFFLLLLIVQCRASSGFPKGTEGLTAAVPGVETVWYHFHSLQIPSQNWSQSLSPVSVQVCPLRRRPVILTAPHSQGRDCTGHPAAGGAAVPTVTSLPVGPPARGRTRWGPSLAGQQAWMSPVLT